jgi:DNA-binding NarL/FixJ family response regulator
MHRVILADNQPVFRAGAARVLALDADIQIIAQVGDAGRLLGSIRSYRASTVLFSSGLKVDTPVVLAALKEHASRGILIVEEDELVPEAALHELSGVVARNIPAAELTDTVKRVARGQRCVTISQPNALQAQDAVGARVRDRLTPKELQIVALIVQGCKNKDIASQLGTKEQVIKNYLRSIYDKTGVSDRLELALFTLHHRMLAEAAAKVGSLLEKRTA